MNAVIHDHIPTSGRNVDGVGVETVHHDSGVMVPVQKLERLLPQNNERSVSELHQLQLRFENYQ